MAAHELSHLLGNLCTDDPPISQISIQGGSYDDCIDVMFENIYPFKYDKRDKRIFTDVFQDSQTHVLAVIGRLSILKYLEVSRIELFNNSIPIISSISNHLTRLDLKHLTLSSDATRRLFEMLIANTSIETLQLYHFSVTEVDFFVQLIKTNRHLKSLTLGATRHANDVFVPKISEALAVNCTLVEFCVTSVRFTDLDMKHLTKALIANQSLRILDLHENELKENSILILIKVLAGNPCLEELNLSRNIFLSKGLASMGEALKTNTFLKRLSIGHAWFDNDDVASIADIIKYASGLEVLDLAMSFSSMLITPHKIAPIFESLALNTGLRELHLNGLKYIPYLEEAMGLNTTLTTLYVAAKLSSYVKDCLERNRVFTAQWCPSLFSRLIKMV